MKKLTVLFAVVFGAGLANAQITRSSCAPPLSAYTPVVVSQMGMINAVPPSGPGLFLRPLAGGISGLALVPGSDSDPTGTAITLLKGAANSASLPASGPIQITSAVYSPDNCGSQPNTLVRLYGSGFGIQNRPTVQVATIIPVCVGGNQFGEIIVIGSCAAGPNANVPQVIGFAVWSWTDNMIVIDTSLPWSESGNAVPLLIVVTNNDTRSQASVCKSTEAHTCATNFSVSN